VVSDTFGTSSIKIINYLLENPNEKDFDFVPLLHGAMKGKADDIRLAIDGMIAEEQRQKMKIILNHYNRLQKCKADLESVILSFCEPYAGELGLVSTVPGIRNPFSAIAIISEIGADMSVFITAKHLRSWAGLTPQNDESAGKKHSVRISRAGVYIKPLLLQCANAVVRSVKSTLRSGAATCPSGRGAVISVLL